MTKVSFVSLFFKGSTVAPPFVYLFLNFSTEKLNYLTILSTVATPPVCVEEFNRPLTMEKEWRMRLHHRQKTSLITQNNAPDTSTSATKLSDW
jgi:hypothetical protein